jgi:hypothetical protein
MAKPWQTKPQKTTGGLATHVEAIATAIADFLKG